MSNTLEHRCIVSTMAIAKLLNESADNLEGTDSINTWWEITRGLADHFNQENDNFSHSEFFKQCNADQVVGTEYVLFAMPTTNE